MNVLVIGSGGREHALAWSLAKSDAICMVYVFPGNAGTQAEEKCQNIPFHGFQQLLLFVKKNIRYVVIGSETYICDGWADWLAQYGIPVFAPTQKAAQLESSKIFAKQFMFRHQIPCVDFMAFDDAESAQHYVQKQHLPVVIKMDGLARGKGVFICSCYEEARAVIQKMMVPPCPKILIERFVYGEEVSIIVVSDGHYMVPLPTSVDYKRAYDGNRGPNTGGMGSCSPAPFVTKPLYQRILQTIIVPTIEGMMKDGCPYTGFLYAGIVIENNTGQPYVLEFNVRAGDPEMQSLLMRLRGSIHDLFVACLSGHLPHTPLSWHTDCAVSVIIATAGYPRSSAAHHLIKGAEAITSTANARIFHGATKRVGNALYTQGGRVLTVSALGPNWQSTRSRVREVMGQITFPGMHYRCDIGEWP